MKYHELPSCVGGVEKGLHGKHGVKLTKDSECPSPADPAVVPSELLKAGDSTSVCEREW